MEERDPSVQNETNRNQDNEIELLMNMNLKKLHAQRKS